MINEGTTSFTCPICKTVNKDMKHSEWKDKNKCCVDFCIKHDHNHVSFIDDSGWSTLGTFYYKVDDYGNVIPVLEADYAFIDKSIDEFEEALRKYYKDSFRKESKRKC